MKLMLIMIAGFFASSSFSSNLKTDVQKQHLKGSVKTIIYYSGNDTMEVVLFNVTGNIAEQRNYMQGKVDDICYYKYDQQNKLIETNSVSWRTVYSYSTSGSLRETNRYKIEDGKLMERMLYSNDSKGGDSVMVSYAGHDGSMNYRAFITIQPNGDREEIQYDNEGKVQRKEETAYDTDHLLKTNKKYLHLWGMESTEHNEYHYGKPDEEGNWTEGKFQINKTMLPDQNVSYEEREERVIEYY